MKNLISLFFLSIIISNLLYAQNFNNEDTLRFYLRKSISFYDDFLLTRGVSIPFDEYEYILNQFQDKVINNKKLIRFDRNPIPKEIMEKVKREFSQLSSPTIEQVKEIIDRTFAPMILKILEIEKEIRAKEFVSRLERNNFLTTKAKEIGITAEDLEKVMNANYIIIAYIDGYKKTLIQGHYRISGGILVYHLDPISSKFTIAGQKTNIGETPELLLSGRAFESAVANFIGDFEVLIRDLFKLSSEITSTYDDRVTFNLGKDFGISLDDKFDFIEFYQNKNGIIQERKVGHGIVKKVGINESELQVITGRAEKGMLVVERPRSHFEFRLSAVSFPLKIRTHKDMNLFILERENTLCLGTNSLFLVDCRVLISNIINIPQTFLTINLFGIGVPLDAKLKGKEEIRGRLVEGETLDIIYSEDGKIGLMKRFYFRKFAFGIQMALKCWRCYIIVPDIDSEKQPSTGVNIGSEISGITEFVLTPDINLGVRVSYGWGKNKLWEFPPITFEKPSGRMGPEVSLETIGWEIYLTINPKIWKIQIY